MKIGCRKPSSNFFSLDDLTPRMACNFYGSRNKCTHQQTTTASFVQALPRSESDKGLNDSSLPLNQGKVPEFLVTPSLTQLDHTTDLLLPSICSLLPLDPLAREEEDVNCLQLRGFTYRYPIEKCILIEGRFCKSPTENLFKTETECNDWAFKHKCPLGKKISSWALE